MTATVVDSTGAAVAGALIQAKNLTTGALRNTISGPEGIFVFSSLMPAHYNITIRHPGFQTYAQNSIDITANEERDLGRLPMTLGAVNEEVMVTAQATPVQTASSENSKLVDETQMADLTLKGRDMFAMMATLPGVSFGNQYLTGTGGDSTEGQNGFYYLSINGDSLSRTGFMVDGVENVNTAGEQLVNYEPTVDTIAEMRVLTTNYQAEYGRKSDGMITVVTKGGGQQFHGTAYANKRHEEFNANTFFNNLDGVNKSLYRFFVFGYSIGGPVYIPKLWNTQKKRVFFFFSQEYTRQKPATFTGLGAVPTSDEALNSSPSVAGSAGGTVIPGMGPGQMQGNFFDRCIANSNPCVAGYTNSNGTNEDATLVNPAANKTALAGGNLNSLLGTQYYDATSAAYGRAMMAYEPVPNICTAAAGIYNGAAISHSNCPTGYDTAINVPNSNYADNYFWQFNETHPRRNDTARMDWNITSKLTSFFRWGHDYDLDDASAALPAKTSTGDWLPYSSYHPNPGHGYAVGITYTITPTLVNEFTFGKGYNTWDYYPRDQSQLARSQMGNPPSFDNFSTDPNFVNDLNSPRPDLTPGSQNFQVGVPWVAFGADKRPRAEPGI